MRLDLVAPRMNLTDAIAGVHALFAPYLPAHDTSVAVQRSEALEVFASVQCSDNCPDVRNQVRARAG